MIRMLSVSCVSRIPLPPPVTTVTKPFAEKMSREPLMSIVDELGVEEVYGDSSLEITFGQL